MSEYACVICGKPEGDAQGGLCPTHEYDDGPRTPVRRIADDPLARLIFVAMGPANAGALVKREATAIDVANAVRVHVEAIVASRVAEAQSDLIRDRDVNYTRMAVAVAVVAEAKGQVDA